MEHVDLLRRLSSTLQRLNVPHFITGSTATIFFAEPRFTNDIDVVVNLDEQQLGMVLAAFPAGEFYVSEDAARAAIRQRTQFNIIHPESGLKIDVMVAPDDAFNRSRFARIVRARSGDFDVMLASPEDVILKKLQYYVEGGSEKHVRDIASMLKVLGARIDRTYIEKWAAALNVAEVWLDVSTRV